MGQYVFRSVGTMVAGTGALTPGMPAGWQVGDLLLCFSTCVSTSETLPAVTGWTPIAVADAGGHANLQLLARIAQGGDVSPSLDWSGTSGGCAQIAAFHGDVFATLASIVAHVVSRESVATRPKIWGLSITTANCLVITMSRIVKTAVSNGTTYNSPTSSITELGEYEANGTNVAAVWGYRIETTAADIAEASWSPQGTGESANVNFLALTVALKSSSATSTAQGGGGTASATASAASAQGSSGVAVQGSGAVAAAVAAAATVSTDTQQIIVASGSPPSSALSLQTLFAPPAVDGDVYVVDKVTAPGGYAVTVSADGTFRFDSGGDESRQIIGVDLIQASNGRRRGRGYVAVNNLAPQLTGSGAGFIESAPITPFAPVDRRLSDQIRDPQSGSTLTFELLAGPLPPGLRLTRGGRLYGVPITLGTYPITIGVRDAFGALTIVNDIIDVAYAASGAGATANTSAASATATVSVSASGAGVSDSASASTGSASGGSGATFNYYISSTGDDSTGDGSQASPWAITALSSKSQIAGKRVGLLDGTYRLSGSGEYCQAVTRAGTSGAYTEIEAVNQPVAGVFSVVITTNNGSGVYPTGGTGTAAIQTEANYIRFRGLKFTDMGFAGISVHSNHVEVIDCEIGDISTTRQIGFADSNCGAIYSREQSLSKTDLLVRNCYLHDVRNPGNASLMNNAAEAVGSLNGHSDVVIEYCTITNVGSPCYIKNRSGNVTIRYCFINAFVAFQTGWGVGSTLRNGTSENQFYGNICVVNTAFGAASASFSVAADIFRCYNNTFVLKPIEGDDDGLNYGYFDLDDDDGSGTYNQSLYFYNNIVYSAGLSGTPPYLVRFRSGTQDPADRCVVMDYNSYYTGDFYVADEQNGTNYTSLATWQAAYASGKHKDLHSAVQDPGLVNPAGSQVSHFALGGSSPCLSTGATPGRVGGLTSGALTNMGNTGVGSSWGCTFRQAA